MPSRYETGRISSVAGDQTASLTSSSQMSFERQGRKKRKSLHDPDRHIQPKHQRGLRRDSCRIANQHNSSFVDVRHARKGGFSIINISSSDEDDLSYTNVRPVKRRLICDSDMDEEDYSLSRYEPGRKKLNCDIAHDSEKSDYTPGIVRPRKRKLMWDNAQDSDEDSCQPGKARQGPKKELSCDDVRSKDSSSSRKKRMKLEGGECKVMDVDCINPDSGLANEQPLEEGSGEVINLLSEDDVNVVNQPCQESTAVAEVTWKMWVIQLEKMKPSIFSGAEAKLQVSSKARQGISVYEGIGMTENNCLGARAVLAAFRKSEGATPHLRRAEKELMTSVSQFLRWSVASTFCSKMDIWKEETLFRSIANVRLVERFLIYFQTRCEVQTVRKKANHLMSVCVAASTTRYQKDIREVSMVLQTICDKKNRATACSIQRGTRGWCFRRTVRHSSSKLNKTK